MIIIVFAPPRTGKTCFLVHTAREVAFDRQRTRSMQNDILLKRSNGFENLQTIPQHCVSANVDMQLHKFGYTPRLNRRINPFRLGYSNRFVETHFNIPFEYIFIDEAQKYFDSHMALYYPDWQSRYYEQHGHNNLDFMLATQRPMLINANIRELSRFLEIVKLDLKYDKFGKVRELKWTVRVIENSSLFDRYMASGKTDKSCYTETTVVADYNVFNCYDSQSCKPKFYEGHLNEDFDYSPAIPFGDDIEGYIKYLEETDDELPKGFYQKRTALC